MWNLREQRRARKWCSKSHSSVLWSFVRRSSGLSARRARCRFAIYSNAGHLREGKAAPVIGRMTAASSIGHRIALPAP